ncbi:MAG: hypothetical protein KDD06_00175 [Phaeodactylibacter sp.]|nr:hypothetical protein [Phaeodactylibacter sp.]MCB9266881.1 hypothetical protein [Lewinellaceae bacterium]MCB9290149.1 hypothetical protein [Lewinellaceae bacterium]
MLAIFRTNQLLASILLVFYVALVRASVWFVPSEWEPSGYGPLAEWVYNHIGYAGATADIVAMALLLAHGFFINYFISEHRLASEVSLFPGLFYILASSMLPEFLHLSPLLMANTFFIIVLAEIFATYKKVECAGNIFNIGFWASVGSLFYPSYLFLFILGFIGLNILRAFRFRERLMMLTGLVTPYLLLSAYYFWIGQFSAFWQEGLPASFAFLDFVSAPNWLVFRSLAIFSILILVVLFSYRSYIFKQTIQVQRKINILFWGLLCTTLTLLIQANIEIGHLLVTAVPVGIMLSFNFIRMPNRMAEVIHLLMLVIIFFLQFRVWLMSAL